MNVNDHIPSPHQTTLRRLKPLQREKPAQHRPLLPHEQHACFVGSGECSNRAAYAIDTTEGYDVYICEDHLSQFIRAEQEFTKLCLEDPQQAVEISRTVGVSEDSLECMCESLGVNRKTSSN